MKIDAHIHAWQPSRRADDILVLQKQPSLVRDAMPETLAPLLAAAGIDAAILVQSAPSLDHGHWCLDVAGRTGFIAGVMAWIDPLDPQLAETLARYAQRPKLCGFRLMLNRMADLSVAHAPAFVAGVRQIVAGGHAVELLAMPEQLQAAARLVEAVGEGRFILDHCGQPDLRRGELGAWRADLARLAGSGAVYTKLSGLAERRGPGWRADGLVATVGEVLALFPPVRAMFASNWPVCDLVGGLGRWDEALAHILDRLGATAEDRLLIYERTARAAFGLAGLG
jgi:L-fuconolactonase